MTRAETFVGEDPLIGQFLGFLAADMASNPERLHTLDATFVQRIWSLVSDLEIDLDAALPADDE